MLNLLVNTEIFNAIFILILAWFDIGHVFTIFWR